MNNYEGRKPHGTMSAFNHKDRRVIQRPTYGITFSDNDYKVIADEFIEQFCENDYITDEEMQVVYQVEGGLAALVIATVVDNDFEAEEGDYSLTNIKVQSFDENGNELENDFNSEKLSAAFKDLYYFDEDQALNDNLKEN